MDIPADYIEKFRGSDQTSLPLPRTPWEEQLDRFLARLNPGREAKKLKPYTHERMGAMLARKGIHNADAAYLFYKRCDGGRSFGGLFEFLIK